MKIQKTLVQLFKVIQSSSLAAAKMDGWANKRAYRFMKACCEKLFRKIS